MCSKPDSPASSSESDRLAEVESLRIPFDAPLADLQAICELAVRVMATPIALVSIVTGDEQRFAAQVGLDGLKGTQRAVSFCTHAIECDTMMVVTDAGQDPRFRDNTLVNEMPGIQAYAGKPLETRPGLRVGTLCVIDLEARTFTDDQLNDLERLAQIAAEILNSNRAKQQLSGELDAIRKRAAALTFLAQRDGMTGLFNASTFRVKAAEELEALPDDAGACLILIDVDNFKTINDRYGHGFGDTYLTALGEVLGNFNDENAIAGRLGGDEFAVIVLKKGVDAESIENLVRKMRTGFAEAAARLKKPELGRASIGLAFAPDHAQRLEQLYQSADVALYASKENGRNRTTTFNDDLCSTHNMPSFRAQILAAIGRDEFVPYYQPKVSLSDGSLIGLEALCRWHHPEKGVILPQDYDAAFRDRAVSPQLTRALFVQATQDLASWRQSLSSALRLAVNVTAYDLTDSHFVADMELILGNTGLDWTSITIEVTETVVMGEEDDQVFASLKDLRERGARIALDDFGTGYGGLKHLRSWPIDSIKIDRSFVGKIAEKGDDYYLVKAIIDLAKSFDLLVVAEGVETAAQRDVLKALKCDFAQGFLYGRAVPAKTIHTSLKAA